MKFKVLIIFFTISIVGACSDNKNSSSNLSKVSKHVTIGKKIINNGAGNIWNTVYFVLREGDTSNLRYDFAQISLQHLEITIYNDKLLRYPELSYREEMNDLKLVLNEAEKDFDLRLLTRIWDISLLFTGDLAIAVTKQLPGNLMNNPLNNVEVGEFLLKSKLTEDLNNLLRPYGKKIKAYVVEKAGFLDSSIYFQLNKIETPKSEVPARILDAQIWSTIDNYGG